MTLPASAFDDARLPEDIEQGSLLGPKFQTTVVPLSSGAEQRNADWSQERVVANISYGIMRKRNPNDVADSFKAVIDFYRARMGRWRGFRFRDWSDFQGIDEPLTKLDNTHALLTINYDGYLRIITRPVLATLTLSQAGAFEFLPGGLMHFAGGVPDGVTASFEFDIPMRFDSDMAQVNMTLIDAASIPTINLISLREDYDHSLIASA